MLIGLLLAAQFWLMSDRDSFWNADKISDHTEFMKVPDNQRTPFDSETIKEKNVLLLVHGYNNDSTEALSTYQVINSHVSKFMDKNGSNFYDLVLGYLWPGSQNSLKYLDAKRRVSKLAKTMRAHLEFLHASSARVDVLAHSMGNRLLFEALNYPSNGTKKIVQNFYSFAAAVDNESIESNEKYYQSTQNCEKLFIFYSKHDDVLKWLYSLVEWDKALGFEGAEDPEDLPKNVQLIDYTNFIGQHSYYFIALPVYEFIKKQFLASNPEKDSIIKNKPENSKVIKNQSNSLIKMP